MARFVVTVLCALLFSLDALASERAAEPRSRDTEIGQATRGAFPTIAKDQRRPASVRALCVDPDCPLNDDPDPGLGGSATATCKCARRCSPPTAGCPLGTACQACKALLGGSCEECVGTNNCGC